MLVSELRTTLKNLSNVLHALDNKMYTQSILGLNDNTIGSHTRHIIEFVQCLIEQYPKGNINYDLRKRDLQIETSKDIAIQIINDLTVNLPIEDKILQLSFTNCEEKTAICSTTYFRETLYNIEHCIHHQALIKVALIELNSTHLIDNCFGVAPSTILAKHAEKYVYLNLK